MDYIDKPTWTGTPWQIRNKIKKVYGIAHDESPMVVDTNVISDGVSQQQLERVFTREFLEDKVGKKKDMKELWNAFLVYIEGEVAPTIAPVVEAKPEEMVSIEDVKAQEVVIEKPAKVKRGKKK